MATRRSPAGTSRWSRATTGGWIHSSPVRRACSSGAMDAGWWQPNRRLQWGNNGARIVGLSGWPGSRRAGPLVLHRPGAGRNSYMANTTMMAVVKPQAAPGAEVREVKIPGFGPTDVLVKVKVASICGTDLHIYDWDRWAQNRIHPPLIPGHEFCGEVVAFGDEVTSVREGDFVSAEMHVACGKCLQCRTGEAHICQNVKIIGVDANGAFAEYVVIPESNIWKLDPAIPLEYASILDPLGNAVHTVLAGEIAAKTVAITGAGPIGLFAIAVARAVGAARVLVIEVNEYRRRIAQKMKADFVLDPTKDDVRSIVKE